MHVTYSDIDGGFDGLGNIDLDPLFVGASLGDYYLSHVEAGQPVDSPCVDSGSLAAESACFPIFGADRCMNELTTRTDEAPDDGPVDMGFHYPRTSAPSTPTPIPTFTPEPTCTPIPTFTPSPSPTPSPTPDLPSLLIKLRMPSHFFHPGDNCRLQLELYNGGTATLSGVALVVMLDLGSGTYWFYPGWTTYPPDFDYELIDILPGNQTMDIIGAFPWPDTESSFSGASFQGALLTSDFSSLLCDMDVWTFGWGPSR
jgi:hypothetical protein